MGTTYYAVDRKRKRMLDICKSYHLPSPAVVSPVDVRRLSLVYIQANAHHMADSAAVWLYADMLDWMGGRDVLILTEHHEAHEGLPWPTCVSVYGSRPDEECSCHHHGACRGWTMDDIHELKETP